MNSASATFFVGVALSGIVATDCDNWDYSIRIFPDVGIFLKYLAGLVP
jgi:hypothetical protein